MAAAAPAPRLPAVHFGPVLPLPRQVARSDPPPAEPPPAAPLPAVADLSTGGERSLARLAALVRAEMDDPDGLVYQPVLAGQLWQAVLSGLLAATADRLREDRARREPASRPRAVKRAIDAMEAEPDRAFTATSLAAAAGTSVRTLQEGFRQHVGMPPMAYLRRLRLTRAHADLQVAEPGRETVASVAHRWGFAHLGRFAAAYRAEYGRAPADTLHDRPAG
ncbi:helix-turn-helix transcriptional regulator [Phytohabitans sp. ZYX-F-186]|uniref:Helix-turn-helix transcriptional regulator n=1 Tax=Phytohabitans maris TaxID=3071409 RepID=A0ABU0Z7W3_9ACTN|nr:helix-turn-helix transcriptional regulator [Phytohabitans sp. ZYX-F-186]MDQ7903133.1 helix-turn-helix transcriptional regulator [Phytohabitans sp. ZYX-F-186]